MSADRPWRILVVDDEPEVRAVTRLVLGGFELDGRRLEIVEAGSGAEAKAILARDSRFELLIVDVVMETDSAGLDLVRFVREELKNRFVRIVLRTGHPGQAPERRILREYEINDYKEKTELTSTKLESVVITALRGYRDMTIIEAAREGLEKVIAASAHVHSQHRSHEFASAVLSQLAALVGLQRGALYCTLPRDDENGSAPIQIAAATGQFAPLVSKLVDHHVPEPLLHSLRIARKEKRHVFADDHYVLHFVAHNDSESLLIVGESARLSALDLHLVKVFCTNVAIAFDNLHLHQDLMNSQLEMICLLAGAAETRSRETANHVKRVGLLAEFLAREYGLDEQSAEQLRYAAPLHDVGKIAVPDYVLNKPGPHTAEEAVIMRRHAEQGAKLLEQSNMPLIRLAAEIARSHHENWDGTGYPSGLAGDRIPIGGRITALADVMDALGSQRCYKEAWPKEDILAYIQEQRGKKFEPRLVDLLVTKWDFVDAMRRMLPD